MKNVAILIAFIVATCAAAFLFFSGRQADGDVPTKRFFTAKVDANSQEFLDESEKVRTYKAALEAMPDNFDALYNIGISYRRIGKLVESIDALKKAVKLRPDHAKAYCHLGLSYGICGQDSEAVEAYREAVRVRPEYTYVHYCLGEAYMAVSDRENATKEYKILLERNKDLARMLFDLIK